MKIRKQKITAMLLTAAIALISCPAVTAEAEEVKEAPVVIMIDPGHGGANMGGQFNTLDEKNLTMITAIAMKEELEKYEGVQVYLTREADVDVPLALRADLAENVGANYLISLHYNMSEHHDLYGAEVWIPSVGVNYAKGYSLGNLFLDEFDTYGLFRRGVKTRVGSGGKDYYGVIRAASELDIPSILVEHCHLDNPVDKPVYNSIESLQAFGRSDATAVAKYFGLHTKDKTIDYSNYPKQQTIAPAVAVRQDMTPPERAEVSIAYDERKEDGMLGIMITGADRESGIHYYSYSYDGGVSWSMLHTMPAGTQSVTVECKPPEIITDKRIVVRLYNGYDKVTESSPAAYS